MGVSLDQGYTSYIGPVEPRPALLVATKGSERSFDAK